MSVVWSNCNQVDAQGKVGWFPASYVELLESRKEEDAATGSGRAVASGEVPFYRVSALPCPCFLHFVQCLQSAMNGTAL